MAKSRTGETVIAHGVRVEGEFISQGNVLVEGDVQGTLQTAGDLQVGTEAKIRADVTAKNAIISGEIRGNVNIAGKLDLMESASIIGDVTAEVLSVAAGAQLNGSITMDGRSVEMPSESKSEEGEDE
jgi:cytoskeletal protein CcmA (bactofilin family)